MHMISQMKIVYSKYWNKQKKEKKHDDTHIYTLVIKKHINYSNKKRD